MSVLSLSIFGPLRVDWGGRPIAELGGGKLAALLVYLVLEPGLHRRESLAALLWPNVGASTARLSLRQACFQLRALLLAACGRDFLVADRHRLGFDEASPHRVVGADLAVPPPPCPSGATRDCAACLAGMAAAVAAYGGPFLEGFALPACPDFEAWLECKREFLQRHGVALLARLGACREAAGDGPGALAAARRLLELEPWNEAGHLRAMQLLAKDGRGAAALDQYETCRRVLERELGVLPNAEIQALAQTLRRGVGAPAAARATGIADRRQVTVLHCQLVAAASRDPEDALERLREPLARCEEIVRHHAGHGVRTAGCGLLAYFGYPRALENGALFAIRAARALVAQGEPQVVLRVGVHSGLIVTTADDHQPDPIGLTSGIAMALQQQAAPGEILVSAETRARGAGWFHFAAAGSHPVPEGSGLGEVFRVLGESGAPQRLAAAERRTPFLGREAELARLLQLWIEARRHELRVLLVRGEAGIGKTRLVEALVARVDNGTTGVRELRCFPELRQSPMRPVISLYESLCGIDGADGPALRRRKVEDFLAARAPRQREAFAPLLTRLLGLDTGTAAGRLAPAAEELKTATATMLVELVHLLAARQPVLFVVEDLHWADASTLDWIARLATSPQPVPLFLLLTARPEWQAPWPGLPVLALAPLPTGALTAMVGALRADLDAAQRARIVDRADGVPLFAEELARTATTGALPASLQDLLMARLDALGPARSVAQQAAAIGRQFDLDLLGRIAGLAPPALDQAIARLQAAGLVVATAEGSLLFKHGLVQEVAYDSLTRAARRNVHRQVAQALEARQGGRPDEHPELLARHWSAAAAAERAAPCWLQAGRRAAAAFAHREAVDHFEAGIALLDDLAAGTARDRLEFALLVGLAQSEQAVAGYGQGRSGSLLARAVALLGQTAGQGGDLFRALWGLWEGAGSRVNHGEAVRLARQLVDVATREGDPALVQQGQYALGNSLLWTGDLAAARDQLERALALEATDGRGPTRDCYGSIVLIGIQVYLSWTRWLQGDPAAALTLSGRALDLARHWQDSYGLAFASTFAATLHRWQGDVAATDRLAAAGKLAALQCHSSVFAAALDMTSGWAAVMAGDRAGLARIEHSIGAIRTAMSGVAVPLLAPWAEALLHVGEGSRALAIIAEALELVEQKEDRHYLAELHRLRGACLALAGDRDGARGSFRQAIAVARAQGALAFARRAEASLAQLEEGTAAAAPADLAGAPAALP